MLYYLNGVYFNGLEQQAARPFDALQLQYSRYREVEQYLKKHLNPEQHTRLQNLIRFIEGFESAFALEILATVDFILAEQPGMEEPTILAKAQEWPSRKTRLLKPEFVRVASERIMSYENSALFSLNG